jgi:hypothetical protein
MKTLKANSINEAFYLASKEADRRFAENRRQKTARVSAEVSGEGGAKTTIVVSFKKRGV